MTALKILHCHSTFSPGGRETRAVRLMNRFGDLAHHVILTADHEATGARALIDPSVRVSFPFDSAPSLNGKPSPWRYRQLADYMRQFDLVLTYGWGSMDAVGARWLFGRNGPPLIHHEDGFNDDEAARLNWKRNAFRRLTLGAANKIVVVSHLLERIAKESWGQPASRIVRIPNGIDTARYAAPAVDGALPGFVRRPGDILVGTLARLQRVKNLPRLIRAVAALPAHVKLAIVGDGPEREAILKAADDAGFGDRLIMPGFLPDPAAVVAHFDIFALSSDSEQFPISLVEAMAAGKPIVSTDVGDVQSMVPASSRDFIVTLDDGALTTALARLVNDDTLRARLGNDNQVLACRDYDEAAMLSHYAHLYGLKWGAAS